LLAQNIGTRLIAFVSQIVLAKLLVPGDFGNLGLALTITTIVGVIANFGVDDVLLQRQKTLRFWTTPAFITSLGLGVISMLIVAAAAPLAAAMYHAPILVQILPLMAITMPLTALATVPTVKIRAELNFRLLAVYSTLELAITQLFTIALALRGYGVYSFVIPPPVMAGIRAIAFWFLAKPKLGRMRAKQLRMMGSNGAAVFGTRILTAAVGQGDYFVLGLVAPKPVVGAYFFAFRLAVMPVQMLAGNFSSVLFPALAQLRNEPERQKKAALNASRMLAFAVMPFGFMQAAVARPILSLVFGAKWEDAIPLVQILSIGLAFDAVSWVAGALLQARGEFRRSLVYSCVFSPIFFVLVAIGAVNFSAIGVATAVSAFYMILAPVYSYMVLSKIGVSFRDIATIYLPSTLFAAIAMISATLLCGVTSLGDLGRSIAIGITGIALYVGLVRLFAPSSFHDLTGRVIAMARPQSAAQEKNSRWQ
jgi:O-antigen/teichoic acid export membrane protein